MHGELFRLALDHSLAGTAVCDRDGRILFASATLERLFGYARGALAGQSVDDLVPDAVRGAHRVHRDAFQASPDERAMAVGRRVRARRRNGSTFDADIGLTPVDDRGQRLVIASVMDVTAQRVAETSLEALEEHDARFERLVAEIAARFAVARAGDIDVAITSSLQQLCEMLSIDRSSLWQPAVSGEFEYTHVWAREEAPEVPPAGRVRAAEHFPWLFGRMHEGHTVTISTLSEVASATDRESLERIGTKANVTLPLTVDGILRGVLTFGMTRTERHWRPPVVQRLELVATVFAHSLDRRDGRLALERALEEVHGLKDRLAEENVQLRREVRTLTAPRLVAAESTASQQVLSVIEQVAPTPATVLMLGETGAGKEVFAQVLHDLSPRRGRPMVRVNCAAIPAALIESELFGRERGAYTGALSRQIGRFEAGSGSTIFLDEVGDLPLEVQVKLLRVLQDHVIERLGNPQPIRVDVRVIAATNRDLEKAVAGGSFREDLYYRLNVFPIRVPPLRERVEDIPSLVWTFIDEFSKAFGRNIDSISAESMKALQQYPWPGNVRELRNAVERAVIVASGPRLDVPLPRATAAVRRRSLRFVDVESEHIRSVLESTGWRVRGHGGAAELLDIKPTTLESRMAKLGIRRSARPMIRSSSPERW